MQCHLCGEWFRWLSNQHIRHKHGLTADEYRELCGLSTSDSLLAPGLRARYRARAVKRLEASVLGTPLGEGGLRDGRWVSLAERRPDLVAEFDAVRNGDLDPARLGVWSTEKVWWRCGSCGSSWRSTVCGRASRGTQCPSCGPRSTVARHGPRRPSSERALSRVRPDLASEFAIDLNDGRHPATVSVWSKTKFWWRCSTCGHVWSARPMNRHQGNGCPECGRARRITSYHAGSSLRAGAD